MADREQEPDLDELNEEADIAADYLEGLLDALDFDGDIEMGVRDGRPVVQVVADDDTDIRSLIGRDGEVVEALQRLTRLAVQEKTGERSRLILDVDGFLTRKRRRLREEALDAIADVNETGEPVTLEDMNSYERKIIHDVARDEGMRSRSHGEEPHRHVTIYLSKADRDALNDEEDDELDDEFDGEDIAEANAVEADEPDTDDAVSEADDIDDESEDDADLDDSDDDDLDDSDDDSEDESDEDDSDDESDDDSDDDDIDDDEYDDDSDDDSDEDDESDDPDDSDESHDDDESDDSDDSDEDDDEDDDQDGYRRK
jgi:spoIIIJ-associated protein